MRRAKEPWEGVGLRTIYWCPNCNVPVLSRQCGYCNSTTIPVRVTPPGDIRPALGWEIKWLNETIKRFSSELSEYLSIGKSGIILFNKIPYPDIAYEVVMGGQIIGHYYYDLAQEKWIFKPLYGSIEIIIRERIGYYAVVNLEKITRNYEIHRTRIVEGKLPNTKGKYVAIATQNGEYRGLGVLIRGKRIRVLKSWKARPAPFFRKPSSLPRTIKANEKRLADFSEEAMHFIEEIARKTGLPVVISFSGGKDSLVVYDLTKRVLPDYYVVFNNTGVELPHTVKYVYDIMRNEKLMVAHAYDKFWKGFEVMGPPARDYRWCCKVVKLAPLATLFKSNFPSGALSLVGQRALESLTRARSPRVWRNRWIPNVIVAAPIINWTALDVWLYIFANRLKPNPLYLKGFDRLGCWLCPACEMGEFDILSKIYPNLLKQWNKRILKYYSKSNNKDILVKYGLWRWIVKPGDISRLVGNIPPDKRGAPVQVYRTDKGYVITIGKSSASTRRIANMLCSLGKVELPADNTVKLSGRFEAELQVSNEGRCVYVKTSRSNIAQILSAMIRAVYCIGCGACINHCEKGALKLEGGKVVLDEARCIHCGKCNENCPLAEYTIKQQKLAFN